MNRQGRQECLEVGKGAVSIGQTIRFTDLSPLHPAFFNPFLGDLGVLGGFLLFGP